MERWPLRPGVGKRFIEFFVAIPMILGIFLLMLYGAGVGLFREKTWSIAIGFLIAALLSGTVLVGSVRRACVQVWITPRGVERRRFGRLLCAIPWDELSDTGVGMDMWATRGGPLRYLYFSDRPLEKKARADLGTLRRAKEGRLITAECRGMRNEEKLRELCPLTIPYMLEPQSSALPRYEITSYRRKKQPDGGWGEEKMEVILHADQVRAKQ